MKRTVRYIRRAAVVVILILIVSACLMCSCDFGKLAENSWFSKRARNAAKIKNLPEPETENSYRFTSVYGEIWYGNLTEEQFRTFLQDAFEYILSIGFSHVGYRGEQTGSLFGAGGNYNVYDCEELSEFIYEKEDEFRRNVECDMIWFNGNPSFGDHVHCYLLESQWSSQQSKVEEANTEILFTCRIYLQTKRTLFGNFTYAEKE